MTNIPKSFSRKWAKGLDKHVVDVLYYRRRQGKRPGHPEERGEKGKKGAIYNEMDEKKASFDAVQAQAGDHHYAH